MDKKWMTKNRLSVEYRNGVDFFLSFCSENVKNPNFTHCPCLKCGNMKKTNLKTIKEHLFFNGIDKSYKVWYFHGEVLSNAQIGLNRPTRVTMNKVDEHYDPLNETMDDAHYGSAVDLDKFEKLISDAEKPIYPTCTRFTKLSALLKLYNLKAKHGWSDKSFTDLLSFLKELLPEENEMPISFYEAKKTLSSLGMQYEKIHACPNDCILYRKEFADNKLCPICGESRWQKKRNSEDIKEGIPAKVLWYLPPIPRFIQLFRNAEHSKSLLWHANERIKDRKLRHPADSLAWKRVDLKWPSFGNENRNLRLGLATDGINPHTSLSRKYSCWPVMLVIYNLAPWLCMKRKFTLLTMLISGPKQPGNDIDVYLAPLIDDLKTLWDDGVKVYDAYRQEEFNLKAVLLWTISDFPAYGNLSGFNVKGYKACPICEENTTSEYLKYSRKFCYMGHRKFLPSTHKLRTWKKAFNGKQELEEAPNVILSGAKALEKQSRLVFKLGKPKSRTPTKIKRKRKSYTVEEPKGCYKKKSIFFELEYWPFLIIRHNLDVMHIEKNICESLIGTLFNIPGKTKDGIKARQDLAAMGIRDDLTPKPRGSGHTYLPPAAYTLTKEEKIKVCKCLFDVKVPDGYSSNIRSLVNMNSYTLTGMKSHDCHNLMQHLLPVAIRSVLPRKVRDVIIRLCLFFKSLCCKVIDSIKIYKLGDEIIEVLCELEKYFPPAFFDIMIHLIVHLVRELMYCGPVYLRWMYPFERYTKILKGYVRNRSRPEGCIVESYIAEEAIEFCSEYMTGVTSIELSDENNSGIQSRRGSVVSVVAQDLLDEAHRLVLQNMDEIQPYIEEHFNWIKTKFASKSRDRKWLQDEHYRTFSSWIKQKVISELNNPSNTVSDIVKWISRGPSINVIKFSSYMVNGTQFNTRERDSNRNTQNCGVSLVAKTVKISSAKDKNPIECDMKFYGVINEIWELDYITTRVPVFFCDGVKSDTSTTYEDFGLSLVNLNRIGHKSNRFMLASQAKQVFYVEDPSDNQWSIVIPTQTKDYVGDLHDIPLEEELTAFTPIQDNDEVDDDSICFRENGEGLWVDDNTC